MIPTRQLVPGPAARANTPARHASSRDNGRVPAARGDLGGYLLQLQRSHGNHYVQRLIEPGRSAPGTGIPAGIRAALERRSGVDLSGVTVHYSSPWPARLGALASTQGSEIHLGPGQEKHIAHEAWHVVQQRQGRVRATRTAAGVPLNVDAGLEREADSAERASLGAWPAPARLAAGSSRAPGQMPAQGTAPAPAPGHPAPVQLDQSHVHRRLTAYRKGEEEDISAEELKRLLAIFAEWEKWQLEADKTKGEWPAGKYRDRARGAITKEVIEALNSDSEISSVVRRKLVMAWNMETKKKDRVTFTAPPPPKDVVFEEFGDYPLWEPLSPLAESYQGGFNPMEIYEMSAKPTPPPKKESKKKKKKKEGSESGSGSGSGSEGRTQAKKRQKRKSKTYRTGRGARKAETEVPIVDSGPEAAIMIRSFQKQETDIPGGFKIIWGPGMFHKGPRADIVYSLLNETGTGSFSREGGVETWLAILQRVPEKYWQDPARFLRVVQAGLRGQAPSEPEIALVCGAMICDVKHGITIWRQVLSELYPMLPSTAKVKPTAMQKLFLNWYEYSASGGRNLRGRKARPSYKEEPRRVKTKEWQMATLIPSLGGLSLPKGVAPRSPGSVVAHILVEAGDPEMLWRFALTNRHFYNLLAGRFRKSRGLELT